MVLAQAMFRSALPLQQVASPELWQDILNDQALVSRYNVLLLLLVVGMFIGLALIVVRNRRALEQEQAKLEEKIQTRTTELARERNLLRTLIDNVPDHFYAKDTGSRFILANQAVVHFMGVDSEKELVGK